MSDQLGHMECPGSKKMLKKRLVLSLSVFLLYSPLASNATVDEDVAALDVRVTTTEGDVVAIGDRVTVLETMTINPDATVIQLRKDCETLDDCFTTMSEMLVWTWNTRNPSSSSPLLINVGPGVFGGFSCNNGGYITLRGSGRDVTIISDSVAIKAVNCTEINFHDFTATNTAAPAAITWDGGGNSNWNNINVDAKNYGWLEAQNLCASERGQHYWFDSRIKVSRKGGFPTYSVGYVALCDESWFIGSEVSAIADVHPAPSSRVLAVEAIGNGIIHVYGSVLRVTADNGATVQPAGFSASGSHQGMMAAFSGDGAEIHIHGTGIDVLSNEANSIAALIANDGRIHANETGYNVTTTGSGTISRIIKGSTSTDVSAPFQWKTQSSPPTIISLSGFDTFIETDCNSDGNCDGGGTDTHIMIYNENCNTSGAWFNSTLGVCRGIDPNPPE